MPVLTLLLLLVGLVLFVLAGFSVTAGRANLIGFGLACWVATVILAHPLVT